MLTFLSSVCSVSPQAATASGVGLRKHWKGVAYIYIYAFGRHFYSNRLTVYSGCTYFVSMSYTIITPLLVNFKLSNKSSTEIRRDYQKDGVSQHRLCEFMNELVKGCHKGFYLSAYFKRVYENPWPSLMGIRLIPAYHVDYTTGLLH